MKKETKAQMVKEILADMYEKSPNTPREEIDKRFKGFLNQQPKTGLAAIYRARFNK